MTKRVRRREYGEKETHRQCFWGEIAILITKPELLFRAAARGACRKPNRHEFVRVRPGEDCRLQTAIFEDKVSRDTYLVDRSLYAELGVEIFPVCLFTTITRQGDLFLWKVRLPGADGRSNAWNESALAAAQLAEKAWTRVAANMPAGMYDTFQAAGELADPEWPELTFAEILKLCFRDRLINAVEHPVIRALRGEA